MPATVAKLYAEYEQTKRRSGQIDFSDLDRSRWVNQTGNSGHAYSDHYDDQSEAWAKNELYDWPFGRKAVDHAGGDELVLVPDTSTN